MEPGKGAPAVDGHRAAAAAERPDDAATEVPTQALAREVVSSTAPSDAIVLVRVTYDAIERDTFSADDAVHGEGTGLLWFDASGRAVVITARSVVDGAYTVSETFGGSVDIAREQITVAVPNGPVLRAHRVWVADQEVDLAALVLDEAPPDLRGTPLDRVAFDVEQPSGYSLRSLRADGNAIADDASALLDLDAALTRQHLGHLGQRES